VDTFNQMWSELVGAPLTENDWARMTALESQDQDGQNAHRVHWLLKDFVPVWVGSAAGNTTTVSNADASTNVGATEDAVVAEDGADGTESAA
jgi:hypothetical protein